MRKWNLVILTVGLTAALAATARGVVIFPKGGRAPIKAALVSQDDEKIVYRELGPNGAPIEKTISRIEIDDIIFSVTPERLQSLRPERPSAYRDYAEELAEKREDPDAREAAIRLYLIAAWLDSRGLGRGCLLGMAGLARNSTEERTFRAMAYLLDPQHDRRLLRAPASGAPVRSGPSPRLPTTLLKPFLLLRQGKVRDARALANHAVFKNQLDQVKDFISEEEFKQACNAYGPFGLPPEFLRKIVQIELAHGGIPRPAGLPATAPQRANSTWSDTVRLGRLDPMPSLSLETITEFNPRECVFRDGQWVKPDVP